MSFLSDLHKLSDLSSFVKPKSNIGLAGEIFNLGDFEKKAEKLAEAIDKEIADPIEKLFFGKSVLSPGQWVNIGLVVLAGIIVFFLLRRG